MMRVLCALVALVLCACFRAAAAEPQYLTVSMRSSLLSEFWQQPVSISAHILLPDSYYKQPQRKYPIFYWIQGFGGTGNLNLRSELTWQRPMRELQTEFIVVMLDGMFNGGHQEFADSANNGPWGSALTQEFVPMTEAHFRAIGTPATRFVGGHSSGGWSALWLQVEYPDLFGGEWSVSPDPVDFRDFTGPDLTRNPPQNFFHDAAGHDYLLDGVPLSGAVVSPGWEIQQYQSFDSVFSPKGADGRPKPLFDRKTGTIDESVARYWEAHYDIAHILRENWSTLGPKLRGKLHVIVGTKDQFGLQRPVELLQKELTQQDSDAEIDYAPGANHFTVFEWNGGLIKYIVREATSKLPPSAARVTNS